MGAVLHFPNISSFKVFHSIGITFLFGLYLIEPTIKLGYLFLCWIF